MGVGWGGGWRQQEQGNAYFFPFTLTHSQKKNKTDKDWTNGVNIFSYMSATSARDKQTVLL